MFEFILWCLPTIREETVGMDDNGNPIDDDSTYWVADVKIFSWFDLEIIYYVGEVYPRVSGF